MRTQGPDLSNKEKAIRNNVIMYAIVRESGLKASARCNCYATVLRHFQLSIKV